MNDWQKILLMPLAWLYGLITGFRNLLFDWRLLKESRFDIHAIGVGNLAVGGAGKTPLIEYLIRLIGSQNKRMATLSRGYKRKTSGFILASEGSTAEEIGDEPLIYHTKYEVMVAVDARRVNGVRKLMSLSHPPEVILLDDVFQHRAIRAGLNILVTDYHNLFFKDLMLPAGTLREYKSGMVRADVIVVTKTPDNITPIELRNIVKDIKPLPHQQVFFSYLQYGELYALSNPNDTLNTLNDLFRYTVISFAGIANAEPMVNYLKEYAADCKHLPFVDHHPYSLKDLEDIQRYYDSFKTGAKVLVTTEKDLMRLKHPTLWSTAAAMNIYILPVDVSFKDKTNEFDNLILTYVRRNKFYHQKYS